MEQVTVSKHHLVRVLEALVSQPHEIRELVALMSIEDLTEENPIAALIREVKSGSSAQAKCKEAIIMANARRLVKPKSWSNAQLYMEIFGTGSTTAYQRCLNLGLEPDGVKTDYTSMAEHINSGGDHEDH